MGGPCLNGIIVGPLDHRPVRRTHDPMTGDHLFNPVGAPAGNPGGGEEGGKHILRDAQHGVDQAGVHIHIGTHGNLRARLGLDHGNAHLLNLLQQLEVLSVALDLRHVLGVLFQQHRPGVVFILLFSTNLSVLKNIFFTNSILKTPYLLIEHIIIFYFTICKSFCQKIHKTISYRFIKIDCKKVKYMLLLMRMKRSCI